MNPPYPVRPSAAKTWTRCTASPKQIQLVTSTRSMPEKGYANEGTEAHFLATAALTLGWDDSLATTDDHRIYLKQYVDYVLQQAAANTVYTEASVRIWYCPEMSGRIDAYFIDGDHLHIFDLKWGVGVPVNSGDNLQMLIYARSMVEDMRLRGLLAPRWVSMAIVQPRIGDGSAPIVATLDIDTLTTRTDPIAEIAQNILADRAVTFSPSDSTCQFCPIKDGYCAARTEHLIGPNSPLPIDLDSPIPDVLPKKGEELTPERMARLAHAANEISRFVLGVRAEVLRRAVAGEVFPGTKLIRGRSARVWASESNTVSTLTTMISREELFSEPEILSVAKMEKLLKARKLLAKEPTNGISTANFKKLIRTIPGGAALAEISDPGTLYVPDGEAAAAEFSNIPSEADAAPEAADAP